MGAFNLTNIKVTREIDLGFDDDPFWLPLAKIAQNDGDDYHNPCCTEEHEGSRLIGDDVTDCGYEEHQTEESRSDGDDSKENRNTS